jgi:hypothetical protein
MRRILAPNVRALGGRTPQRNDAALRLFDGALDRAETEIPDWYLSQADGAVIAGEDMLRAAGWPGRSRPAGWSRGASGFKKTARDGKTILWVQRCGQFWIIERSLRVDAGVVKDETLVFAIGPRPIWTRTPGAGMWLAEYCDTTPPLLVAGYWADVGNVRVA